MKTATNFKTTTARENSENLQRYLKITICHALQEGPLTWDALLQREGIRNQGVIYVGIALRALIANCRIVETAPNTYRLAVDTDVNSQS